MPEVKNTAPPDGGWGWVVCLACFATHVLTDGVFYSFGIIFDELLLYFNENTADTAIVASLAFAICFLSGPITAAVSNHAGKKSVVIAGTFIMAVSFIASMFAPNIFFLYFTFGAAGWGFGMVYLPSIVCVTTYFEKKRAFAVGLGVSGSGIGTFIFSPVTRALIDAYTWKGALLIQSALIMNCFACGLVYLPLDHPVNQNNHRKYLKQHCESNEVELTVMIPLNIEKEDHIEECKETSKLKSMNDGHDKSAEYIYMEHEEKNEKIAPPKETSENLKLKEESKEEKLDNVTLVEELISALRQSFNFRVFYNKRLLLYVTATFFYGLGYFVPYVYIPVRAKRAGIDSYSSAWLVSSIGIANTAGRILFGFLSDKKWVNRLMLYNTSVVLCGVGTALCPFCNVFETLLLYTVIFGLFSGVTVSLTSVIIADFVGTEMLADAFGVMNFFTGIAIFGGPPIAGWLFDVTNSYDWTFVATGIAITISGAMMYAVPLLKDQRPKNEGKSLNTSKIKGQKN